MKNILSSIHILFIIFSEYLCYMFSRNRIKLIKNITKKLKKKNIIFSKIFQIISTQINFLTEDEIEYMIEYTDQVQYNNNELYDISELTQDIYNTSGREVYIEPRPINSGLISIIYNGKYEEKDIIVKVKRKNIENIMTNGINEMKKIISLLNYIPYFNTINIKKLFNENSEELLSQCNFINEAKNTIKMYDNFKNIDNIIIPKVYIDITAGNDNVIVLDKLYGKKLLELNNDDKEKYKNIFSNFIIKSILLDGYYHADLHSGNIFFMNDNNNLKIGIIDYGIMGNITDNLLEEIVNFFIECSINQNFSKAATIALNNLVIQKEIYNNLKFNDKQNLINKLDIELKLIFNGHTQLNTEISYKINKILRNYNLELSKEFCKMQMALAIGNSIVCKLDNSNYIKNINNSVKEILGPLLKYID